MITETIGINPLKNTDHYLGIVCGLRRSLEVSRLETIRNFNTFSQTEKTQEPNKELKRFMSAAQTSLVEYNVGSNLRG